MSGFSSAPPPRWVGIVGQRRQVAGFKPVTHLIVHGDRVSIVRWFPSAKDQLPWFMRAADGKVLDLRHQPTRYGVRV